MREYHFHHVDVFTQTPFEGNPLAVFTDGRGLDTATMQRIAREMNLSESTFVFPPTVAQSAALLRIFTPAAELAFAGHPTIGTAFVLHRLGMLPPDGKPFTFEEGVGPVPVRVDPGEPFTAWLRTPPVTFEQALSDRAGIAASLGLAEADLLDVPIQIATAGNPFLYVALRNAELVDRSALDLRAYRAVAPDAVAVGVYVFAVRGKEAYSRMFAPEQNIIEDPATGSATGPLAAYLMRHGLVAHRDGLELVAEQGTHMGRRSILRIRIGGTPELPAIDVGGSAVALIGGTLRLP